MKDKKSGPRVKGTCFTQIAHEFGNLILSNTGEGGNTQGGMCEAMCCELKGSRESTADFFIFFSVKNYTYMSADWDLSIGATWLAVYVTHHPELYIGGRGDCPEFLF